jgi:hypothetical protein
MINQIVTYPAIPAMATSVLTLSSEPASSGLAWDKTLTHETDPYFDPVKWMPTVQEGGSTGVVVVAVTPKSTAINRQTLTGKIKGRKRLTREDD